MTEQDKSFFVEFVELIRRYWFPKKFLLRSVQAKNSRFLRLIRWMTPNGGTILLVAFLVLTQNVWARGSLAGSNAPGPSASTVNYQGRLANPDGTPVADNTYTIAFALYDAASSGNVLWGQETHAGVQVSGGLFSVGLGDLIPIPTSVWNGNVYLEIQVNGETLSPRELIRSVPIAGIALTCPPIQLGRLWDHCASA